MILSIILILLIVLSAILSASETSLFSLSSYTLKSYAKNEDSRKNLIFHMMKKPRDLLVTILMMNIFANILVQNTVSSIFGNFSSWALKVGVPLFLTLFFGEIIPKTIALPNNKKISYKVAPFISFSYRMLKPIRLVLVKITEIISRTIFFFLRKEKHLSYHEIHMILEKSKEKGILSHDESELIKGYLKINDSLVKEEMRPREEIIYFDINKPISDLIYLFKKEECTRIPVCDKNLDNVLGIISSHYYFFHSEEIKDSKQLIQYLKKPFFVPDTLPSKNLLFKLRHKNESIALVVDEYGSISGIITQEDIVESIIGEISDLRDIKSKYTRSDEGVIIASGKLELDEFRDIFGFDLPKKSHSATLGGWIIDQFEDIPQAGTKLEYEGFLFYILSADPNRIKRVYIRRIQPTKKRQKK